MNEKELMEHLKAGIFKREAIEQEQAAREEAERIAQEVIDRERKEVAKRNHQAALSLEPLVEQMLIEWPSRYYACHMLGEALDIKAYPLAHKERNAFSYSIARTFIESGDTEPLLKLKMAMDYAGELWDNRHDEVEEPQVDAKALLAECEEELEEDDDKPSLMFWWCVVGALCLWWFFNK